jgi:hypothetical protein
METIFWREVDGWQPLDPVWILCQGFEIEIEIEIVVDFVPWAFGDGDGGQRRRPRPSLPHGR